MVWNGGALTVEWTHFDFSVYTSQSQLGYVGVNRVIKFSSQRGMA